MYKKILLFVSILFILIVSVSCNQNDKKSSKDSFRIINMYDKSVLTAKRTEFSVYVPDNTVKASELRKYAKEIVEKYQNDYVGILITFYDTVEEASKPCYIPMAVATWSPKGKFEESLNYHKYSKEEYNLILQKNKKLYSPTEKEMKLYLEYISLDMPAKEKRASLKEVLIAFKESIWALIFPVILIVGIRFGVFTPSEAGAFAAVYAIFVGAVIYKELTWEAFKRTLRDSAMDIGAIMLIIALSGIIGYGIVYDGVSQKIATLLISITSNPAILLLIIIVFLVIAGMFVETTVIALLLTPILLPVVTKVGIDPVHFGVIMMTNVTMGIMTPPLGVALYTVSSLMECPPEETVKESIPFFIAYMVVEALLLLFPQLVLFIPNLIFG